MTQFDAFIFDLDGLLIDSERIYMRSWLDAAARVGFDLTLDFYLGIIGMPYRDCLDRVVAHLGPDFPVDRFIAASDEIRVDLLADGMSLKPGVVALLDYLTERDFACAVASSSRRKYVTDHLESLGVENYFQAVVSRNEVSHGKPHPEPVIVAAERVSADPEKCLALEDSRNGIRSAAAAGMAVVMVPDLLPPDPELRDTCLMIADDLFAVRDWLAAGAQAT